MRYWVARSYPLYTDDYSQGQRVQHSLPCDSRSRFAGDFARELGLGAEQHVLAVHSLRETRSYRFRFQFLSVRHKKHPQDVTHTHTYT